MRVKVYYNGNLFTMIPKGRRWLFAPLLAPFYLAGVATAYVAFLFILPVMGILWLAEKEI